MEAKNTKAGGFLVGRMNGKKIEHNDASLGGLLVGRRHSEDGIKGVNVSTGQPIEVEDNEIQISSDAATSSEKQEFEGKMMTNKEILSELNVDGGGIAFRSGGNVENSNKSASGKVVKGAGEPIVYKGNEIILTRGAVSNTKKYDFNGKKMTTKEIASCINEEATGVSFGKGGGVAKSGCDCVSFSDGGSLEQTLHGIYNAKVKFKIVDLNNNE